MAAKIEAEAAAKAAPPPVNENQTAAEGTDYEAATHAASDERPTAERPALDTKPDAPNGEGQGGPAGQRAKEEVREPPQDKIREPPQDKIGVFAGLLGTLSASGAIWAIFISKTSSDERSFDNENARPNGPRRSN